MSTQTWRKILRIYGAKQMQQNSKHLKLNEILKIEVSCRTLKKLVQETENQEGEQHAAAHRYERTLDGSTLKNTATWNTQHWMVARCSLQVIGTDYTRQKTLQLTGMWNREHWMGACCILCRMDKCTLNLPPKTWTHKHNNQQQKHYVLKCRTKLHYLD